MAFPFKLLITVLSVSLFPYLAGTSGEYIVSFGLILTIGITHGANDRLLEQLKNRQTNANYGDKQFFLFYLGVMAVYSFGWYLSPIVAFIAFLLLSAFHFGEAQLVSQGKLKMPNFMNLLFGTSALLLILFPHEEELTSYTVPYLLSSNSLSIFILNAYWLVPTVVFVLILSLSISQKKLSWRNVLDLAMILMISHYTSLLYAFAVFFTFWHSWDATMMQIKKLKEMDPDYHFKMWLKAATPFTLVSWIGIGLVLVLFQAIELPWPTITSFFVLVSIITLPHTIVMNRFYRTDYSALTKK